MSRDYAKYNSAKMFATKPKQRHTGIVVGVLVLVGCLAGSGFFYVKHKEKLPSSLTNQVDAWVAKIPELFHHAKKEVKPEETPVVAEKKTEEEEQPTVHFNFYTELESGKIKPSAPAETTQKPVQAAAAPLPLQKAAVVSPDEISNLLDEEEDDDSPSEQYILQLGIYQSEDAAKRLDEALENAGFQTTVVKTIINGRKMYRVQKGSFTSMESAKAIQQQFKKRGVVSVIRKISEDKA